MATVLEEYLVALGFKIDGPGEKRFKDSLDSAGKTAAVVAASLTAAYTAIAASVIKIASEFDNLYFSAQRTNTSVANIKSLTYALSQIGVSANEAGGAIEGIARALRTNPGTESVIRDLGVKTRDANGNLRDTVDLMVDLDRALTKKPYYQGAQYAGLLGIDEGTFNKMHGQWQKLQESRDKYLKKAAEMGVDPDKAGKEANDIMTKFRELQMQIGLVIDKIAVDLGEVFIKHMNELSAWITAHQAEIVQFVKDVTAALVMVANWAVNVAKSFDFIAEAIGGKGGVQAAMAALLAYTVSTWLVGMLGAAGMVRNAFLAIGAVGVGYGLGSWLNSMLGGPAMSTQGFGNGITGSDIANAGDGLLFGAINKVRGWFGAKPIEPSKRWGVAYPSAPNVTSADKQARVMESFNFWKAKGFTDEQAAGMVANEMHETGMRANPVGDTGTAFGSFQWRDDRVSRIANGAGIDVRTANHQQSLEAAWWELNNHETAALDAVRNAKTPEEAAAVFSTLFERPKATGREERMRAVTAAKILADIRAGAYAGATEKPDLSKLGTPQAPAIGEWTKSKDDFWSPFGPAPLVPGNIDNSSVRSPTIHQTNHTTITGTSDPVTAATQVERALGRHGEGLLGNLSSAMQ